MCFLLRDPLRCGFVAKKMENKWEGNNRKRLNACVVCVYIYICTHSANIIYVYIHYTYLL